MTRDPGTPEPSRPGPRDVRLGLLRPVLVVVTGKIVLFAAVYLSTILLPPIFSVESFVGNFRWPRDQSLSWVTMLRTWDAQHYLFIAEQGYQPRHMSNAMYPLWPLLIRLGRSVTGDSLVSALVLSNALSIAGLALLHRLVKERHGDPAADATLLLSMAFPGALFYCFAYSESLFLLLTVSCFFAMHRRRLGLAAACAALVPATRAVGIFIVLPLAYAIYEAWRARRVSAGAFALTLLPLLGAASVLWVMYLYTGDAFAGFEAQYAYVSEGSIWKIFDLGRFLRSLVSVQPGHSVLYSPFDRLWFVLALVGLWLMFREEKAYFLYALPVALVPAISMSFMAYTRYVEAAFPLFIVFGIVLSRPAWREARWLCLTSLAAIQLLFLIRHVNNYWAG